jgi:urease accessory protein
VVVDRVLGELSDDRFTGRRVEPVDILWGDARKHRRLVTTARGRELALRLPRGTFLAEGTVLLDDGDTVVAVRRPAEDAVVVELAGAARAAFLLGYRLGNQHAPVELAGCQLRTPLLTGPDTATEVLRELGVPGGVRRVPLAARGWSRTSGDHAEADRPGEHGHGTGHV